MTAKCGAHIELELVDCATNTRCASLPPSLAGLTIQVWEAVLFQFWV